MLLINEQIPLIALTQLKQIIATENWWPLQDLWSEVLKMLSAIEALQKRQDVHSILIATIPTIISTRDNTQKLIQLQPNIDCYAKSIWNSLPQPMIDCIMMLNLSSSAYLTGLTNNVTFS